MRPWWKRTLLAVAVLAVLYGGLVAYETFPSRGETHAVVHLGHVGSAMYLRCDADASTAGVCSGGDQATITVPERSRLALSVVNDDGGGRTHDLRVEGWQYVLPPVRPEMEMQEPTQSHTFTAWAAGDFHILCELGGHEAAGMWGTLRVV